MRTLKFLFAGRPGVKGLARWEFHLWILIGLLLAKAISGGLESIGRLLAVNDRRIPGYIEAAGPFSDLIFWPTALLFLYLAAAIIPTRGAPGKGEPGEGP